MLTEKLVGWYRKVSNAFCWIFIIVGIVGGFIGGSRSSGFGLGLLSAILGGAGSFILELLIVPPVLVLFEINEKLDKKL
ncbi:MAG: hypothetical protein K6G18_03345 [Treponema sp.]|nr:hypothetical protein [Treponema sp.]